MVLDSGPKEILFLGVGSFFATTIFREARND
jgi:hypothetical protein